MRFDLVKQKLKEFQEFDNDLSSFDLTYRIYHNSYKMFYMAENCMGFWQLIFDLYDIKPYEDYNKSQKENNEAQLQFILINLEQIRASHILIEQMKILNEVFFEPNKRMNTNNCNWALESVKLLGIYTLTKQIVQSTLESLNNWIDGSGILWEGTVLNSKELLMMESIKSLSFRVFCIEESQNKIKSFKKSIEKLRKKKERR